MHVIHLPSTHPHSRPRRLSRRTKAAQLWVRRARFMGIGLGIAAVAALTATLVARPAGLRTVTVPAGTRFVVALRQTVSTATAEPGQLISLTTREPIRLTEDLTLPAGLPMRGEVTHAEGGGRIAGAPELTIRFTEMEVGGKTYRIVADPFRVRGRNDALQSVAEIGGGAVAGGVIGAIAGSAAKGAVIGGLVGTGVAVATKGDQIVLPAGQRLRIRLAEPVTLEYTGKPENLGKY